MTEKIANRYAGSLVGVLAGDALGAPYEKWEPEAIRTDFDLRGGLTPFDYPDPWGKHGQFPAGLPTDDSEFTAALAESLIEKMGTDPEDQFRRFKTLVEGVSTLHDRPTHGFGKTTRLMLRPDTYAESQERSSLFVRPANGSLMRSAPLALFYRAYDEDEMARNVRISSRVTHVHDLSVESCQVFARTLAAVLNGTSRSGALMQGLSAQVTDPELTAFLSLDSLPEPPATNQWPPSGHALHTLHIALWAFLSATSFSDGIEKAVLKGGDTDTAAAVTGALLGAYYGLEGIPASWQEPLMGRAKMVRLAEQLYTLSW